MQTIRDMASLKSALAGLRRGGSERVALVPTMGALHDGHLALVRTAQQHADHVVVSIFVNPTQFGPNEDLDAYPRREAEDAALLEQIGTTMLWLPDVATMYPAGHVTRIRVAELDSVLCGAARPGHFDGVATIVAKLFNQVAPDIAIFGEKDWQQLAIIRQMVRDLDMPVDVLGLPTVREADGLARSSRNAYLSAAERGVAAHLPRIMADTVAAIVRSAPDDADAVAAALAAGHAALRAAGFDSLDYFDLRDGASLQSCATATPGARLFVAARIGRTRLIDNIAIL